MKRLLRVAIVMGAVLGAYAAAGVQRAPAVDGQTIPICPPPQPKNCKP